MASILFCSILYLNSIASKRITLRSPHVPSRSLLKIYPSSVAPACFWLVVECGLLPGGSARPRHFLFFHFLSINSTAEATPRLPPTHSSPFARPHKGPPHHQNQLYLIAVFILWKSSHLRPRPGPSLSLNFGPLIWRQTHK
jgi:hypothetical protein